MADWTGVRLGRGATPRVEPMIAELQLQEDALAKAWTEVESNFIALGAELQEQVAQSRALLDNGQRLVSLAAPEHNPMQAAAALVQETLQFIDECRGQIDALVTRLQRYHEQTGRLLQEEQKVERIVAPLRIIQTLFRIESSGLPSEAQAAFGTVASEIPRFEQAVRQAFEQHAEALTMTRQAIDATTAQLRACRERQESEAQAKRERIAASLRELDEELQRNRQRDAQLAEILGEVDRDTGEIVVNLQYQDISRQKMEHVRDALRDLQDRLREPGAQRSQLEYAGAICDLQALQTAAIDEELRGAVGHIAEGLQRMMGRLQQIERECWSQSEVSVVASTIDRRVEHLRHALADVRTLLPLAMASAEEVVKVVRSFGEVAADVATAARDMAESMRLIALNAQVLAAQAGEHGAGLLILAERTYGISQEIRAITDVIGTEFAAAAEQRATVVAESEALSRLTEQHRRGFDERARPIEQRLGDHSRDVIALLTQVGELLAATHERVQGMTGRLAFEEGCSERLDTLRGQLAAMAGACKSSSCGAAASAEIARELEEQQRRYTTDAERAMHALAMERTGATATARPPADRPPSAAPPPARAEAPAAMPAALGDNVELF